MELIRLTYYFILLFRATNATVSAFNSTVTKAAEPENTPAATKAAEPENSPISAKAAEPESLLKEAAKPTNGNETVAGDVKNTTTSSMGDYASYLSNKTIGGVQHISHDENENIMIVLL